ISFPSNTWHHIVGVGDGTALRIYVDGSLAASGGVPTASYGTSGANFKIGGGGIFDPTGNFFAGLIDEVAVYHRALTGVEVQALYQAGTNAASFAVGTYVATDVSAVMSNINASAQVRLPFVITDTNSVSQLNLRVRYDDGYVAWINGVEVARANAADPIVFNSAATASHSAAFLDDLRVGVDGGLLQNGTNILAIQGMNLAANDSDFVIRVDLIATVSLGEDTTPTFFTVPTPGKANSSGSTNLGPIITEVKHTPNVPLDAQDLVVTARISPAFNQVTNVSLQY